MPKGDDVFALEIYASNVNGTASKIENRFAPKLLEAVLKYDKMSSKTVEILKSYRGFKSSVWKDLDSISVYSYNDGDRFRKSQVVKMLGIRMMGTGI